MDCSLDRNNKVTQFDSLFKNSGKISISQLLVQIFGFFFSLSGLDIIPIFKLKLGHWISTNTPFNKFPLSFNIGLFWINLFFVYQKVSVLLKKDRFAHYFYIKKLLLVNDSSSSKFFSIFLVINSYSSFVFNKSSVKYSPSFYNCYKLSLMLVSFWSSTFLICLQSSLIVLIDLVC